MERPASMTIAGGALPEVVAVFPLTGVILLPGGRVPLRVFEPRYLAMTEDALAGDRLIALVQPRDRHADPVPDDAPLRQVGCVGRLIGFNDTLDGRYGIALLGLRRFRIVGEEAGRRGYRRLRLDYTPFLGDDAASPVILPDRPRLLMAARACLERIGLGNATSVLAEASDELLVTGLSQLYPFDPEEKQALLEAPGTAARAAILIGLLEMALHGGTGGNEGFRH